MTRPFANTVIRASAGTGKTFQLSNRFIGLAAAGEPLDTILASTFTRKAAGEILDRVLTRLAAAALDAGKLAELKEHVEGGRLTRKKSLELVAAVVRRLHRVRVGTLDSFFVQIAQAFGLELGLPPGWQIVDEMDDAAMKQEAVRRIVAQEATGDAVELMHLLHKGEAARSVAEEISGLVNELYGAYVDAPKPAWRALPRFKPLASHELQAAIDAVAAADLSENKRLGKARNADLDRAAAGNWDAFLTTGLPPKLLAGDPFYGKPIPDDIAALYRPLIDHAKAELLGRIANQTEGTRRLLGRFDDVYRGLKFARQAVRFDDVTRLLADFDLAGRLDEVVYRLDAPVAHLLLDEFQDTSPPQWRVLRPFARVSVGGPRRSFFCVGDVKQAIYGWRGGVAEIFDTLNDELPELAAGELTRSFRSSPVIIDVVNRVFRDIETNGALRNAPEAARAWGRRFTEHSTAREALPGYCRIAAAPRAPEGQPQGNTTLDHAAAVVKRLHEEAPGCSIGVLVRRNASVARLIYRLRRDGVDASEEGGNPLTDSPAVQLVLSLLRLVDHPGDTVAGFHVAGSPLGAALGFTDHTDRPAVLRLAGAIRRRLMDAGYGPVLYGWAERLAEHSDARDLSRLVQLVELGYGYEPAATTRTDAFVAMVEQRRVESPTAAPVRVMNYHQVKGLQFDVVVLPELDFSLRPGTPSLVVGRPKPSEPIDQVCRYVSKNLRPLLPERLAAAFEADDRVKVEEALCILYVALTRPIHALWCVVAPSSERERNVPSTAAGVLRMALTGGGRIEPETTVFEHGQADWHGRARAAGILREPAAPAAAAAAEPLAIELAPPPEQARRGLERVSPSGLEGGHHVKLATAMNVEGGPALDRGTLVHAWFEQIEWLDDGLPDDAQLDRLARRSALGPAAVEQLKREFRAAVGRPEVAAALSRAYYEQPGDGTCAACAGPDLASPHHRVWRERPFALYEDGAILGGTIDRLTVLYDGSRVVGADVLDFKTDALPPGAAAALAARVDHYRPQLDAYRRAVARQFRLDLSRVSARLAFVGLGVVVGV